MHRCWLFCHNQGIYLDEYMQVTKHPTYLGSLFLDVVKQNSLFFSICVFFHEYSRFTWQQGKGEAISLLIAISIWLVSWYVFSTVESSFTRHLRIVLVSPILTIAPLISESLLGKIRVTMAILWQSSGVWTPFHKNLPQYY